MEKNFLSNKKNICPVCNNENLELKNTDLDENFLTYSWKCNNCNSTGFESYRLIFDGHYVYKQETDDYECVSNYPLPEEGR